MRKFKIDIGKVEIARILEGGFRTPAVVVQSPPIYILAKNEVVFNYIASALDLQSFNIQETTTPIVITQPNLN